MSKPSFPALDPWFRLFRLPNLLTVPGDPLAGFLLAGGLSPRSPAGITAFIGVGAAAVALYLFGLAVNDIVDVETDRAERPDRPIPSGAISVSQARMAAIAAVLSGLNLALIGGSPALIIAAVLAFVILAYDAWLKPIPAIGCLAMGVCRGLSVALGVAAARPDWFGPGILTRAALPAGIAIVGLTLHVAAFSAVAKKETQPADQTPAAVRFLPFVTLLILLPAEIAAGSALGLFTGVLPVAAVFVMSMALMRAWMLGGILHRLLPVPEIVGGHIRNLLMVQACLCLIGGMGGLVPAAALVLLSLVFKQLSRRFYSS